MSGRSRARALWALPLAVLGCGQRLVRPPLHEAAIRGDRAEVARRLRAGEPIDLQDVNGDITLLAALLKERWEIADLLARRGADVNHVNRNDKSLVQYFERRPRVLDWLRRHGSAELGIEGVLRSKTLGRLRLRGGMYDSDQLSYGRYRYRYRGGALILYPQLSTPEVERLSDRLRPFGWSIDFLRGSLGWRPFKNAGLSYDYDPGDPARVLAKSLAREPLKTIYLSKPQR